MAASPPPLRAGVIGAGFIAPVHIEALRRIGVPVTAVCASTASARALAARWDIPEVHGDHDAEALIRSPNVDVVHITSPNRVHVAQTLAALAAGKHVVCEKPLGMTPRETARVVAAARRRDAPLCAVNYMCRFFPGVLQMRAMVQRGDLGRILHVQGHFFQDWLLLPTDYNWRLLAREGGKLRAVGDIGTHWLDTVSFILGARPTRVLAHLGTAHPTRLRPRGEVETFARAEARDRVPFRVDTEDYASLLLTYGKAAHGFVGGTHANVSVSQVAAGWKCSLAIGLYGEQGSVRWDFQNPNELHVGRREGPNEVRQRGAPGFLEDVAGFTDTPGGHPEGFPDSHKMHYRAIYDHLRGGRRAPILFATAADGHHEVQLCEAILRSHRERGWIKV
jgi:predicted dehydrogenase